MLSPARRPRRAARVLFAAAALLACAALSACAPPPPACPPEVREAQQAAFIELWGAWGPVQQWKAGWYWADPANCVPPDPETPPPVVSEAPVVALLPVGGILVGGLALVIARRRRSTLTV